MAITSLGTSTQTLDTIVSEVKMITLDQVKMYDGMNLEQLEDIYTSTIKSIRNTDNAESQINLGSKLSYLRSIIKEKKNA